MTGTIDDEIKGLWKTERRRNLKGGASVRNVTHRTFELWRLIASHDESTFQNAVTWNATIFGHPQMPRIGWVRDVSDFV